MDILYKEIWEGLQLQWGASFSKKVIDQHTPGEHTTLVECIECGLQYFLHIVPGNSAFYDELSQSPAYYKTEKWEFEQVKSMLSHQNSVLDIGCGEGQFLLKIKNCVRIAVGIDTNPEGIRRAKKAGVVAHLKDLDEFSEQHQNEFDVVCCFQIVEHFSSVRSFFEKALDCVIPGGKLVVSVPNINRLLREDQSPLDCPPHHISRWDKRQFAILGNLLGIRISRINYQLASIGEARAFIRKKCTRCMKTGISIRGDTLEYWVGRILGRVFFSPTAYAV